MELYSEICSVTEEIEKYNEQMIEEKVEEDINTDFLDEKLTGHHTEITMETSVLNDYRNWGIERVCLDGFQNHLAEDSKGTISIIQLFVDDIWINLDDAIKLYGEEKLKDGIIKKIRFADNGVGFDKNNLRFLSSQKSSEDLSVGQFGEGLKLVAMTSVNLGLDMEVQSKNWSARATGKDVELSNYRDIQAGEKKDQKKQLTWEVSEYSDSKIKRI